MKKLLFIVLLAGLVYQPAAGQSELRKSPLRVLYVGGTAEFDTYGADPADSVKISGSIRQRMESFENFLKEYFTEVSVVHADQYAQQLSYEYDVTILDGRPRPVTPGVTDREKGIYLQPGYFTEDFDRPVVTIGEIGDRTGRRLGIKNDWYCLCLDADAHHWRPEHPIFNGPFAVNMTVNMKPTPEDAFHYPYYHQGPIPEQIPMWTVQTTGYVTEKGFRIGMVSRPWGYEDSPDTEYISSGVCQKTLDAVAIGRHGNFFHWGFAASPAYLTEEAKPVLANAIVYAASFAGQTPIARKYNDRTATREYLKELRYLLTRDYYEQRLESDARWAEKMVAEKEAARLKQARGETLTQDETRMLGYEPPTGQRTFEEHLARYGKEFFELFGTDIPAYGRYFDENYDYFYGGEGSYVLRVDEDVKSLGIPNSDKRLLDRAITLLEKNEDAEKARRILYRYTLVDFPTAAQWREWYDTYRDRFFWSESGGWLFLIDSREPGLNDYRVKQSRTVVRELDAGQTDDNNPVAAVAEVTPLQEGGKMLVVKVKIHPGYHIYRDVSSADAFIPTELQVELPEGYLPEGDLSAPAGKYYNQSGTTVYEDEVVFTQKFSGMGNGLLRCTFSFQCCDTHICFPPEKKEWEIKL